MRILIIDSDKNTTNYIRKGLRESGFVVDVSPSGKTGIYYSKEHSYDLVLLDLQTPDMDGWHVLQTLRTLGNTCILILSAHAQLNEKLRAFETGADDYLAKPFQFPELLARMNALLRRAPLQCFNELLEVGDLRLDLHRRQVLRGERRLHLAPKEFALLHLLMRHEGRVITRRTLISALWDSDCCFNDTALDVTVCRLRMRVDAPFEHKLIHTRRGVGYFIEARA